MWCVCAMDAPLFYSLLMKKLLVLSFFVLALFGCKTNEENYRQSYETAISKIKEKQAEGVDSATYNKIIEQQKPKQTTIGDMAVRTSKGYAWQSYGEDIPLMKYNVVVGAMKQKFNAEAMCDRLRGIGCQAYVITDRQKNYFVIAAGYNDVEKAATYITEISKHITFPLPISEPYIYDTTKIYIKK